MLYKVAEIVRDVRVALDENSRERQLLAEEDADTLSLDERIAALIEETAREAVEQAPVEMLEGTRPLRGAVHFERSEGRGAGDEEGETKPRRNLKGWMVLPDDFLRLVAFRMSDWERPATEALGEDDPRYGMQHSRYGGIRGNPQRPVVAIVRRNVGLTLEIFSCRSEEAYVAQGRYMAAPRIDGLGGIEIPQRCYRAVVNAIAGKIEGRGAS